MPLPPHRRFLCDCFGLERAAGLAALFFALFLLRDLVHSHRTAPLSFRAPIVPGNFSPPWDARRTFRRRIRKSRGLGVSAETLPQFPCGVEVGGRILPAESSGPYSNCAARILLHSLCRRHVLGERNFLRAGAGTGGRDHLRDHDRESSKHTQSPSSAISSSSGPPHWARLMPIGM